MKGTPMGSLTSTSSKLEAITIHPRSMLAKQSSSMRASTLGNTLASILNLKLPNIQTRTQPITPLRQAIPTTTKMKRVATPEASKQ
eukprot:CAMPEP_0170480768 /NCGR_PEP_ID=MMETSP0208-20121228/1477_1 /TAXON_ID=197538 /ORGANISM="Strombidium inclinatum, Strain S3" /LENGTH=85 /DNA_ID=CAMNT_0010753365 /DNA_START=398 /DNA_END=655 /DNA_ORIENTATION=+